MQSDKIAFRSECESFERISTAQMSKAYQEIPMAMALTECIIWADLLTSVTYMIAPDFKLSQFDSHLSVYVRFLLGFTVVTT